MAEIKVQDGKKDKKNGAAAGNDKVDISAAAEEAAREQAEQVGDAPDEEAAEEAVADEPEEDLTEEEKTYKEQLQRLAADFDNYRKRAAKDRSDSFQRGVSSLAERLLPVLDNLELAIKAAGGANDDAGVVKGVSMVCKMFTDALSQAGITRIDASDGKFDPRLHEALFTEETADIPPDTILEEIQTGYRFGDRLLRPTKVKIAVEPAAKAAGEGEGGGTG